MSADSIPDDSGDDAFAFKLTNLIIAILALTVFTIIFILYMWYIDKEKIETHTKVITSLLCAFHIILIIDTSVKFALNFSISDNELKTWEKLFTAFSIFCFTIVIGI
jgi:membrane protein YdbS with pleckstrin-like domain